MLMDSADTSLAVEYYNEALIESTYHVGSPSSTMRAASAALNSWSEVLVPGVTTTICGWMTSQLPAIFDDASKSGKADRICETTISSADRDARRTFMALRLPLHSCSTSTDALESPFPGTLGTTGTRIHGGRGCRRENRFQQEKLQIRWLACEARDFAE
ncbi:hypothetical protein R1flu_027715 [Riccia fluitans]|uniref:Uncharacterized protein n=1 Tax=Riccia fluitans TaxID=41844 RepID=A0ABD1XJK7_9MARC